MKQKERGQGTVWKNDIIQGITEAEYKQIGPGWWTSQFPLDLGPQPTLFIPHKQAKWYTYKWVEAQLIVKELLEIRF